MLGAVTLLAWAALLALDLAGRPYGLCLPPAALRSAPDPTSLLMMLAAMMTPVLLMPVHHARQSAFAARRGRATLCFAVGYLGAWLPAGLALQWLARFAQFQAPGLDWPAAMAIAGVWQASPWKQRALNACHRLPALAAWGWRAERQSLAFGVRHGGTCVAACWALMLLPMLAGRGHLALMALVTVFLFAERQERPARATWAWRLPRRLLRQLHFAVAEGLRTVSVTWLGLGKSDR